MTPRDAVVIITAYQKRDYQAWRRAGFVASKIMNALGVSISTDELVEPWESDKPEPETRESLLEKAREYHNRFYPDEAF